MISIIIAFNKGKDYLADCFESIQEQTCRDFETILVLDCAMSEKETKAIAGQKDNSLEREKEAIAENENNISEEESEDIGELLEKYRESVHLKVYTLEKGSGVAAARNLGMEMAQGEYLYFLDSDDYILKNTLERISAVMKGREDLAYGRLLHTWFKKAAFRVEQGDNEDDGSEAEAESACREECFDFSDIMEYRLKKYDSLDKITALGALYRKRFLEENHIRFNEEQKYYADAAFWIQVLNCADKYGSCENSIYVKRYHNDKVNLPALSQVEDARRDEFFVKAFLEAMDLAEKNKTVRAYLEELVCRFYVEVYSRSFHDDSMESRMAQENSSADKERFLMLTALVRKCSAQTFKKFGWVERKILKYAAGQDMEQVKKWADTRLVKRKLVMMFTSRKHFYRTLNLYVFRKMKQKDNWIVFESFVGRNYSGQPKYIYKYLQEHYGNKYRYIWVVNDKKLEIDGKCTKVKRFGLGYYYYMTRSKYWVNNMRQPHSYPKRDSQIMLETWHGTPLKKLVFDMDDVHSANPKYKQIVYKQSRKWDYLLSDNPFSTEKFQSCFLFEKEKILELGYPANDPLYASDLNERAVRLKKKMGIPQDKKVLLYAPTWRDDNSYGAGEYKFELALDLKRMRKEFGEEYVILLRVHYWVVDRLDLSDLSDFVINVSDYSDITDIYIVSDICMTDYSSVFFDYANLKRPILFYMYDLEKYRDVLRGFYLDIEKELPGPILTDNTQVVDAIKNLDSVTAEYREKYEQFYERFCALDDGHAAERVCNRVFLEK